MGMNIVLVSKVKVLHQLQDIILEVEKKFNKTFNTTEGIGEFMDAWITNDNTSSIIDKIEMFGDIGRWPDHPELNSNQFTIYLFKSSIPDNYYVIRDYNNDYDSLAKKVSAILGNVMKDICGELVSNIEHLNSLEEQTICGYRVPKPIEEYVD